MCVYIFWNTLYILTSKVYCFCHPQSFSRYKYNKCHHSLNTIHSLNKLSLSTAMSDTWNMCLHFITVTIFCWRHSHHHFAIELSEIKSLVWDYPASEGKNRAATLEQIDCKSCTLPTGPPNFLRSGKASAYIFYFLKHLAQKFAPGRYPVNMYYWSEIQSCSITVKSYNE